MSADDQTTPLLAINEDIQRLQDKLKDYDLCFENLVFEGGGVKLQGHVGAIKVLEQLGILKKCRRFAGTSGGAIVAAFLSVGMTSADMHDILSQIDFRYQFVDAKCGSCALPVNLLRKFGWNPGKRFQRYVERLLQSESGISNITFKQVYDKYDKELCVVATNLSTMCIEYFHPKTTPDVPVSLAVKCSAALPGYVQPVKVMFHDLPQYFTDGGILCNYPVHVFDGWYLSMDYKDAFFFKLGKETASVHFRTFNPKTIGFVLMSEGGDTPLESELWAHSDRVRKKERPKTKLAKSHGKHLQKVEGEQRDLQAKIDAAKRLVYLLRMKTLSEDGKLPVPDIEDALSKLSDEDIETLYGSKETMTKRFHAAIKDKDGLTMDDFTRLMARQGIRFRTMFEGGNRKMSDIKSVGQYLMVTLYTIIKGTSMAYEKADDIMRTVGIDTDYITTTDFVLEEADKEFLINQGVHATILHFTELVDKFEKRRLPEQYDQVFVKKEQ